MSDPTQQPGFSFTQLRVLRCSFELGQDTSPGSKGELALGYDDKVVVSEKKVTIRQYVEVRVVDPDHKDTLFLRAHVELEGVFESEGDTNMALAEFGNNHAPGILFAFSREWIHKLTSEAGEWPAVLLSPVNILEMRKNRPVRPA